MPKDMKIKRSVSSPPRRGRPVPLIPLVLLLILIALIGWFWVRGGEQPLVRVEKPVVAERLGR